MKVNNSSRRRTFVASSKEGGQCPTLDCGSELSGSKLRDDYIATKIHVSKSILKAALK